MKPFSIADRELILCSPNESFRWNTHRNCAKWHHHPELEIHLIQSASGHMVIGDQINRFSPGTLVMTGPNLPHNFVSDNTSEFSVPYRDVVGQFTEQFCTHLCSGFPEMAKVGELFSDSEFGLEFSGETRSLGACLLKAIGTVRGPQRLIKFLELLLVLSETKEDRRIVSYSANRFAAKEASSEKLASVMRFIYANYTYDIFLHDVAKLVAMESSTFSRFFLRKTGHNFNKFIILLRVHHACRLLTTTSKSMTSICYESGFNNTANFNDKFRKICSTTPSKYRAHALRFTGDRENVIEFS